MMELFLLRSKNLHISESTWKQCPRPLLPLPVETPTCPVVASKVLRVMLGWPGTVLILYKAFSLPTPAEGAFA